MTEKRPRPRCNNKYSWCGGEKPLKVKVLDNEWHHIHYKGKVYTVDSVLTIKDKDFDPNIFVQVANAATEEDPVEEATLKQLEELAPSMTEQTETYTVPDNTAPADVTVTVEEKPKKKRRKKTS